MKQKHYMDISRVKGDTEFTEDNTRAFEIGDKIVIQEKVDGSNASIVYDAETKRLLAFSRKQLLSASMRLNGFWDYVQQLEDAERFAKYPNYVFFGEWLSKHTIRYQKDAYGKWYFFDVFDRERGVYLPQSEVKKLADELEFIYVKTFYTGEFISWEHVAQFAGQSDIAEELGEGIVVKNMTKLNDPNTRYPFYLKIVVDKFCEIKHDNHKRKIEDPQRLAEKAAAQKIVEQIVTENRVRKELLKLMDEEVLPRKIAPQDMKTVAVNLPKRIYDDCVKEEPESVEAAGKYFGRLSNQTTMGLARQIIFGDI